MRIPCSIYRGGTSKPVFFLEEDLPADRDVAVLRAFGSPDPRQIDGIGGGDPLTSKVAYVKKSGRPDADVDYTYGYVGIDEATIDYKGNCGNTSAAVPLFARAKGLVEGNVVRIFNTNTEKIIVATVAEDGLSVSLDFIDSQGATTGKLLPTGEVRDVVRLTGVGEVEVAMVDAVNPFVFVRERSLDLQALDELRRIAGERMGIGYSPGYPKASIVWPSERYDLEAKATALDRWHKAYAVSGAVCTAVAAKIPGTVVHEVARASGTRVTIGHPSGSIAVEVVLEGGVVKRAAVERTARLLMEGEVIIP